MSEGVLPKAKMSNFPANIMDGDSKLYFDEVVILGMSNTRGSGEPVSLT
jgi:hypothetical protein